MATARNEKHHDGHNERASEHDNAELSRRQSQSQKHEDGKNQTASNQKNPHVASILRVHRVVFVLPMQACPDTPKSRRKLFRWGVEVDHRAKITPTLMPLGDQAILVRFADRLDLDANAAAIAFATILNAARLPGVVETSPNLVSVLVRYDPQRIGYSALAGEIGLVGRGDEDEMPSRTHAIAISYGGEDGPDIDAVAHQLGFEVPDFIAIHRATPLRVLSTGFAPGFVYCGMHEESLLVPRRELVRPMVPPGSVLFAARQTAIAATVIPTGWSVIGRTRFVNFEPAANPPTRIRAGDSVVFEDAS